MQHFIQQKYTQTSIKHLQKQKEEKPRKTHRERTRKFRIEENDVIKCINYVHATEFTLD